VLFDRGKPIPPLPINRGGGNSKAHISKFILPAVANIFDSFNIITIPKKDCPALLLDLPKSGGYWRFLSLFWQSDSVTLSLTGEQASTTAFAQFTSRKTFLERRCDDLMTSGPFGK